MTRGTLQLLVHVTRPDDDLEWAVPLSWADPPPDAAWQYEFPGLDLGDYDCAPLPRLPKRARGLWLLTWPWREIRHPEEWDHGGVTTAKFARTGTWRRPTLADLVALDVLPTPTEG